MTNPLHNLAIKIYPQNILIFYGLHHLLFCLNIPEIIKKNLLNHITNILNIKNYKNTNTLREKKKRS